MARQVVTENPVSNSPLEEPARHLKFGPEGVTKEIVEARRRSAYFTPVDRLKERGGTGGSVQGGMDRVRARKPG